MDAISQKKSCFDDLVGQLWNYKVIIMNFNKLLCGICCPVVVSYRTTVAQACDGHHFQSSSVLRSQLIQGAAGIPHIPNLG
jgi:hypothetical protein